MVIQREQTQQASKPFPDTTVSQFLFLCKAYVNLLKFIIDIFKYFSSGLYSNSTKSQIDVNLKRGENFFINDFRTILTKKLNISLDLMRSEICSISTWISIKPKVSTVQVSLANSQILPSYASAVSYCIHFTCNFALHQILICLLRV